MRIAREIILYIYHYTSLKDNLIISRWNIIDVIQFISDISSKFVYINRM